MNTEQATGHVPVICIDGPSGSGKGTISRLVAGRLGWHFLDSGALYRLTGLAAIRQGVSLEDSQGLGRVARHLDVRFDTAENELEPHFVLQGEDVTEDIRSEACSLAASKVAVVAAVRDALLARQRDFRQSPGLVADGRDMGTVVFPNAEVKIFLVASAEERAKRRHKQLKEKGINVSLGSVLQDIEARDARDSERSVAPLQQAQDAWLVDSTDKSIDQVVDIVIGYWRRYQQQPGSGHRAAVID